MSIISRLARTTEVLLLLVIVLLIAGQALGQPILLGFVETGSMQPTLETGDGFVAVPSAIAGSPEPGDVAVFRAEELHGGGLVTHRIVGVTEQGYVTRGDANDATDQQTGEPPVKDAQVVAHALQVGGKVIAIPQLQLVIDGAQAALETANLVLETLFGIGARITTGRLPYVVFGLSILLYGVSVWRERSQRALSRDHNRKAGTNINRVVLFLTTFVVITATGVMVLPAGSAQYGLVATQTPPDSGSGDVVKVGESTEKMVNVPNAAALPVVVYLEPGSSNTELKEDELYIESGEVKTTTAELQAPKETGYYRYYVIQHRYFALLPQSTIRALYDLHPWLPIAAIDALIGIPFYLLGMALVDTGRVRARSRDSPSRLSRFLARWR